MGRGRSHPDGGPSNGPAPTRRSVRSTYDRIASHFAETRPAPWSEVESFVLDREGQVGLDVGVGNGRHAELLSRACSVVVGVDASRSALATATDRARTRGFDVALLCADAATLPLDDECVDVGVYVATVHHLPTRALRRRSLSELARVLRSGGRAIVSAWSVTHDRFSADEGFDTTVDWTLPDGETVGRFYHVYDLEEFVGDIDATALARVRTFESEGNCYAVVEPEQ